MAQKIKRKKNLEMQRLSELCGQVQYSNRVFIRKKEDRRVREDGMMSGRQRHALSGFEDRKGLECEKVLEPEKGKAMNPKSLQKEDSLANTRILAKLKPIWTSDF